MFILENNIKIRKYHGNFKSYKNKKKKDILDLKHKFKNTIKTITGKKFKPVVLYDIKKSINSKNCVNITCSNIAYTGSLSESYNNERTRIYPIYIY